MEPPEVRVERVAQEKNISHEEARSHIEEIDGDEPTLWPSTSNSMFPFRFVRRGLRHTRFSAEACAETIAASARSMQEALEASS